MGLEAVTTFTPRQMWVDQWNLAKYQGKKSNKINQEENLDTLEIQINVGGYKRGFSLFYR